MDSERGPHRPGKVRPKESRKRVEKQREVTRVKGFGKSHKARTEVSIAFCENVTGNLGKISFIDRR